MFSTQFVNTRSGTSIMESDLAVTPAGVSTIAVYADSDTDFGNGQDSVSLLLGVKSSSDLVQFDASGKVLFRKTVPSINSSLSAIYGLATNASGFLWGVASGTSLVSPSVMNYPRLTVGITASGASAWQQTVTEDPLIAAGPSGAVTFSSPGSSSTETLQGLAPDGSTQWTVSTPIPSGEPQRGLLVVDSSGNPLLLDLFRGTIAFGSAPTLTSAGGNDSRLSNLRRDRPSGLDRRMGRTRRRRLRRHRRRPGGQHPHRWKHDSAHGRHHVPRVFREARSLTRAASLRGAAVAVRSLERARGSDLRRADGLGDSVEDRHALAATAGRDALLGLPVAGVGILPVVGHPDVACRIAGDVDEHPHAAALVAAGGEMGSPVFRPGGQVSA